MPLFDQDEKIRPTVPFDIYKGLKLLPSSIDNWNRSNRISRQYDTFIGVTYIRTGLSILLPAFEDDWRTQKRHNITGINRTLRTIRPHTTRKGEPLPSPWYQGEDKKIRVPYQQAIDDYEGVANILKVEHMSHVDGLYHQRAAVKLQTNRSHTDARDGDIHKDFLGWAIKSNKYECEKGESLQMVFSSSRNRRTQDFDYNLPLWNNKIRHRSPERPGIMENRDINNIWANAIAMMLSRDLDVPTNKISVFSGKKHWVVNTQTLRKEYILCPEQIRTAPGKRHIYRRNSRILDVSEHCNIDENGYLYLHEYITMACHRYLEEYTTHRSFSSKKSKGYIRIKNFQENISLCNNYSSLRLCVQSLYKKTDSVHKHSFISYLILYLSYTPARILAEFSIPLSGLINRMSEVERCIGTPDEEHWRNRIF